MLASAVATREFASRMLAAGVERRHYRDLNGRLVSTIGHGTYLGAPDDDTDAAYAAALKRSIELGTNFLDTAINYRYQRSERVIGRAVRELIEAGTVRREELVIATKGGFFPFDGERPSDPAAWVEANVLDRGLAKRDEIVAGQHCMTPAYLRDQLERSLANLGLDGVDLYYVHNPETQLRAVDRREFQVRLQAAFEMLEGAVAEGLVGGYGLATWNGFRADPEARDYLAIEDVVRAARAAVGSGGHHWCVIQLPYNVAMHEAFSFANQTGGGPARSAIEAARGRGVDVVASGTIGQGRLASELPEAIGEVCPGLESDAQRAIQFVRSTPGITSALVGMGRVEHVEHGLGLAQVEPADPESIRGLFGPAE